MRLKSILSLSLLASQVDASLTQNRLECRIKASGTNQTDDAPAIRAAFKKCGRHGKIIFSPTTYYINSVLNVTELEDVDIDIQGELLVNQPYPSHAHIMSNLVAVGHRYPVLAQCIHSRWLSKYVHSL